jgi:hypothetical protein
MLIKLRALCNHGPRLSVTFHRVNKFEIDRIRINDPRYTTTSHS